MSDNKGLEMFGRGFFYVSQWCSHLISSSIFWRNMDFAWFHMVSHGFTCLPFNQKSHTCWISSTSREVWTTSKTLDQWKMTIWPRFCSCVRQALFKFLHFPTSALRLLVQVLRGRNVAPDCYKADGLVFQCFDDRRTKPKYDKYEWSRPCFWPNPQNYKQSDKHVDM